MLSERLNYTKEKEIPEVLGSRINTSILFKALNSLKWDNCGNLYTKNV